MADCHHGGAPLVDKSWSRPARTTIRHGSTGKLQPYCDSQLKGRAIYVREGCWIATRSKPVRCWPIRNVPAGKEWIRRFPRPTSSLRQSAHVGTKRTGPDYRELAAKPIRRGPLLIPQPTRPDQGSCDAPLPWIVEKPEEFTALVAYIQTLGRAKNWRPDNDYESEEKPMNGDYVYPSIFFSYFSSYVSSPAAFVVHPLSARWIWGSNIEE